ncbi:MAG: EutN/CcmL family microcompartment protein [Planctomycetota bacterium]|nr:ethanolamine utilization protein EutN [Planctomycetota bacterium]MEE2713866.1 EutN/CcmL family microcompartment protein [Planctomycetota bacterium]
MYLGRVIGTVWATRRHQALEGGRMVLVQPIDDTKEPVGQPLAALDTVGSGAGEIVLYVTAYEAAMPWLESHPGLEVAGVDASVIGIVDRVDAGAST